MLDQPDWPRFMRVLEKHEKSIVKGHFLRLDATSRRGRFWYNAPVIDLQTYVDQLDLAEGIILGCFPDNTLRGLAECRPLDGNTGRVWEGTLSVEASFQERGMGTSLLGEVADLVHSAGGTRLYLRAEAMNGAAPRLARRLGADIEFVGGDQMVRIDFFQAGARSANAPIVPRRDLPSELRIDLH